MTSPRLLRYWCSVPQTIGYGAAAGAGASIASLTPIAPGSVPMTHFYQRIQAGLRCRNVATDPAAMMIAPLSATPVRI